ncbi:MAG: hypothetical protein ACP5Q5_08760 [Brevinematia bacterium]
MKYQLLIVLLTNRLNEAIEVQKVLTEFGCYVKTRLGLHEANENLCSDKGLMVLQLIGDENEHKKMKQKLEAIKGVKVQYVVMED